jgi:Ni/Fe-hydrogenase 1 B-type cytochrome subunit
MGMQTYSRALRIWHWLNALAVLGLLGTFFLRKTFLSWRDNAALITSELAEYDIVVTAEQAKTIAKAIRAPMWEWHIILGFIFAALMLWRLGMIAKNGFGYEAQTTHMRFVQTGYKLFYLLLLFMALSGMGIYFMGVMDLFEAAEHDLKELHELVAWTVVFFVPLHIAGTFVADNRDLKGLVSKMISG